MPNAPLPFALTLRLPIYLEQATLIVEAVAQDDPEGPPQADDYAATAEVVALFGQAIDWQLLTQLGSLGRGSSATLIAQTWEEDLPGWRFALTVTGFLSEALRVLLAMLVQTHHAFEPLARVTVSSDSAAPAVAALEAGWLGRPGYPPRPVVLPFRMTPADPHDWPEPGTRFSVWFEFEQTLPTAARTGFTEGLNVWDHLLVLGGFSQDYHEAEELDDMGDIVCETPSSIRHDAVRVGTDDADINALLNLANAAHAAGARIDTVRIEAD